MSRQFSDTTNKNGLYEKFLDATKNSTASYPIAKFTSDANDTMARYFLLAIKASQKWQVDDTNHADYNILTINLVSGQQDYPFTSDASSTPNQVLTIDRVECKDSSGNWMLLKVYDEKEETSAISQTQSGIPFAYHQTANGIFLKNTPNYNSSSGLKVYFKRTPSYFLSSDTTKTPGIPDVFHEYVWLRPAYFYCVINLPKLAQGYLNQVLQIERDIPDYYFLRNQNQPKRMIANIENNR